MNLNKVKSSRSIGRIALASMATWVLGIGVYAHADIAQSPLFLGGRGLPGNMVLVPSVEFPTIISVANIEPTYSSTDTYVGYFDSEKCYKYVYSATASERYFKPASKASSHECTGSGEWSGNFLNWAATQTIDPFRKVLTGGYRVKDTPTETWLEKARHTGQGSNYYPDRTISGSDVVAGATPFSGDKFTVRINGLGSRMRFTLEPANLNTSVEDYGAVGGENPEDAGSGGFDVEVRVSVCDSSVGIEDNCVKYSQGYKPEGLLQENAETIRFSIFGYLNDSDSLRDGGVLRAQQKYVGPYALEAGGFVENSNKEWDPDTGQLIKNPDSTDASNTAAYIVDSGVINYLNKFGQLTTNNHKSYDPVSELYYAATRYLKNQGNVSAYSDVSSGTAAEKEQWRDGFPVIENWDDPIQYACQKNVILGIGDAYTHRDKNLPGNTYTSSEPNSVPSEITSDTTVNVITQTNKIGKLEELAHVGASYNWNWESSSFSGRGNSAYIAGLAWDNHVRDMRNDVGMDGLQTASTYWVDVQERQRLEDIDRNQYYLATKYGGFQVPEDFDPNANKALEEDWWHTNGETITGKDVGGNAVSFKRPDNYYLAGDASKMASSLKAAFSDINSELNSSASAIAANSSRLDTDSGVFQASFNTKRWSGELAAYKLKADGTVDTTANWNAGETLDKTSAASRKIYISKPFASKSSSDAGAYSLATGGVEFKWANLDASAQKPLLQANSDGTTSTLTVAEQRLNYLRGDRTYEKSDKDSSQPFRQRDSVLGDIINSNPQYSHDEDFGYYNLPTGGSTYAAFQKAKADYPPVVYVGGNDGMLHVFNAEFIDPDNPSATPNAGKELFAFVPGIVLDDLYRLTEPKYTHQFFVDGTVRIADAYVDGKWAKLAVGTTGGGGASVFALNVTDPGNPKVLWEFTHPKMGYTIYQSSIVPLSTGGFGVVVTSGYHDTPAIGGDGNVSGYIWILDAANGEVLKTFELDSGDLGAPLSVDLGVDRVADRIYVGDSSGRLWRLDIHETSTNKWGSPFTTKGDPAPLFIEPNGRPITAPLTSAYNDNKDHMVFFGTGSFIRSGENVVGKTPAIDRFYGIVDIGQEITADNQLVAQSITHEGIYPKTSNGYRVVSNNAMGNALGWYLPLVSPGSSAAGERVISRALVRADPEGNRVIFTTMIPDADPCAGGGRSWLMEVGMDGARLSYDVFDYNNDGSFDNPVNIGTDDAPIYRPGSGIQIGLGIIGTPTVVIAEDGDEYKLFSSSTGEIISIREAGSSQRAGWEQLR